MFTRERVVPIGHEQIACVTSTGLTVPSGAQYALITTETQNARFRDDGTAPTATVGQLIKTTDPPLWYTGKLSKLRFIEAASAAKINVAYYG